MKLRVLFVDDEPRVLEGFEDLLWGYSQKWDMVFAPSGASALSHMEKAPFDVIVADMRMPEMDGITLLRAVRDRHAETIRIVLSGHSEMDGLLPALPVLHQFLYKPCEPRVLGETIERVLKLRTLVGNITIRKAIGRLEGLPTLSMAYRDLRSMLAQYHPPAASIARIIRQDIGMSAKILQLANSAFFGLGRRITHIEDAVAYLGIELIGQLIPASIFDNTHQCTDDFLRKSHAHALITAEIASAIMSHDRRLAADAWAAGFLHDIGKLVLASEFPEYAAAAGSEPECADGPGHQIETELYGVTHAEVGAYLLGIWGLPEQVVDAVANHHVPRRPEQPNLDVTAAVHAADSLACECQSSGHLSTRTSDLLRSLGLEQRVDDWRRFPLHLFEQEISHGEPTWTRAQLD
jgi:putative nucleotidyltransferase with HDIG domain